MKEAVTWLVLGALVLLLLAAKVAFWIWFIKWAANL